MNELKQKRLVIVASTLPRWKNDSVASFVQEFGETLAPDFAHVTLIAPHYKLAKTRERLASNITVRRFRYFFPASGENIVYEGHAGKKANKSPLYLLKLTLFLISNFFMVLRQSLHTGTIINAHWIVPQGAVAVLVGKLLRKPVVVTVHGGDVFTLNGKYMLKVKRWVLRHASTVVVNSSATQAVCQKIYSDREYPIIPMGIDTTSLKKKSTPRKGKLFRVLFIGRLSSEKGGIYVCKAAQILKKSGVEDVAFTIVGDGPEKPELEAFVATHNLKKIVSFEGWQPHKEIAKYYHEADVFVGPSIEEENGWKEAYGLTFAEASASGLPVIATNTGGIRDIVKDGITGFLVQQRDAEQITDKILLLKDNKNLRQTMGKKAAEQADRFSWESTRQLYEKILRGAKA